jgi:N-acetylmuramoyl-L-alanine amidase
MESARVFQLLFLGAILCISLAPACAQSATIAVDAGHSPAHPGAVSARGRPEFEFNRDLAQAVAAALERRGFAVRLINGQGDIGSPQARIEAAAGAEFFLSIHHDSVQPRYMQSWEVDGKQRQHSDRFSGFSLFVSRANPQVARGLICASAIGRALRMAGRAPSLYHAEPIPGEDRPFADAENGVHYSDDLVVLRMASQPAVLLEAGVIVNRQEELLLEQPQFRETVAAAVADGLARCLASR